MPPKQVQCSVCKKTVLKSKTLHIGNGERACREHDGVEEKNGELVEHDRSRLKQSIEKVYEKKRSLFEEVKIESQFLLNSCWRCDAKGIPLQEFYYKCAVAIEKIRLKGESFDFFNHHKQIIENLSPEDRTPLILLGVKEFGYDLLNKIQKKNKFFANISGSVQLCSRCIKELDLMDQWEEKRKKILEENKPTLGQLHTLGAVMQPELEKEAKREMVLEQISKGEFFTEV